MKLMSAFDPKRTLARLVSSSLNASAYAFFSAQANARLAAYPSVDVANAAFGEKLV